MSSCLSVNINSTLPSWNLTRDSVWPQATLLHILTAFLPRHVTSTYSTHPILDISATISDDNSAHQSPLLSLDLSSRCSSLSRALSPEPSPEHASESAGSRLGGSPSGSLENRLLYIEFAGPIACNTATSLSLLRCRDGIRSRSTVVLIKDPCRADFGSSR
jgi:hypothetical protein